jgi:hypothetical protein
MSLVLLAGLLLTTSLMVLEWMLLRLLVRSGLLARFVQVADLSHATTAASIDPATSALLSREFDGKDAGELLAQVMNGVVRVESFRARDVCSLFEHIRSGGGLDCGGMSRLYLAVLQAHSIEGRLAALRRNLVDAYDVHVTVEVRLGERWVIYDPTFHVNYARQGELLGVYEIGKALYQGSYTTIAPVFRGAVSYPARLETYYMHWLPLFNNVAVWELGRQEWWARVPPLRYWVGPRYSYQVEHAQQMVQHEFVNRLYFMTMVILPLLILLAIALLGIGMVVG